MRPRGLSAFPLTPVTDEGVDEAAFAGIVDRLVAAGVDSIGALGSTGSYAYLDRDQRARVVEIAVAHSGEVPVVVGVGATGTRQVLAHVEDAVERGADALLLPPVTYQPLTDDEVYGLYADVTAACDVPVVVYDNPGTTHVTFSDELHARITALPGITSIKIPPVDPDPATARERVARLRAMIPDHVGLGISGDAVGAVGLLAGCDTWYSVLAGTLPDPCRAIVDAARAGDIARALAISESFSPLWDLFDAHGSYRVVSALAEELGLVGGDNLPRPVLGLDERSRDRVRESVRALRAADLVDGR